MLEILLYGIRNMIGGLTDEFLIFSYILRIFIEDNPMNTIINVSLFIVLFFVVCLFLTGCAPRHITLVDFQTGETLDGQLNESDRNITVTMPDGEVLSGKYSAISNTSPVYETGVGVATGSHRRGSVFGTGITIGGGGPSQGYGLLKSNTSNLMMEIVVSYSEYTGHGYGEAITNDGRKYKVQF